MKQLLIIVPLLCSITPALAQPEAPTSSSLSAATESSAPSRFSLTLDASAGYSYHTNHVGAFFGTYDRNVTLHGAKTTISASLLWRLGSSSHTRLGLKGAAFVYPRLWSARGDAEYDATMVGGSLAFVGRGKYLWGSVGLGVNHASFDEDTPASVARLTPDSWTVPELVLAGGLDIPLSERLSLFAAAEVETCFLVQLRVGGSAGLKINL